MKGKVSSGLRKEKRQSNLSTAPDNRSFISQKLFVANDDKRSNELTVTLCEKLLYCHALLSTRAKERIIKPWQPKLTSEERRLFDESEFLSADQTIIANACKQQTHRQQMEILSSLLPIHRYCRQGIYPGTSIARQEIHVDHVPWTVDLPNYHPPYHTDSSSFDKIDSSDPEEISSNLMWNTFDTNYNVDRRTACPTDHYLIDRQGYPLNPLGRTGLCGRGNFRRWAVNYQTHLVILCGTNRIKSGKEIFEYLIQKSKRNHNCHLPSTWTTGTNKDAITTTLRTFLSDLYQRWNTSEHCDQTKINQLIDHLTFVSTAYIGNGRNIHSRSTKIYFYELDDPHNTDNAWLETSVYCYVQTLLDPSSSSDPTLDLKELFPNSSASNHTTYAWHRVTRRSRLLDSEREVVQIIAKQYNAYW